MWNHISCRSIRHVHYSAYTAIDIAVEQILMAGLPEADLEAAIRHAIDELGDKYSYFVEATRVLSDSKPPVKLYSLKALRLLQTIAMAAGTQPSSTVSRSGQDVVAAWCLMNVGGGCFHGRGSAHALVPLFLRLLG